MIDLKKRGVIILTHYRSGGTLLRTLLEKFIPNNELIGEIDFIDGSYNNDTTVDYKKRLKETFSKTSKYKIIQLNNPLVISYLSAIDYFSYLDKHFSIIHLERTDIKKALLSLPLWEEKIEFENKYKELTKEELKIKFHNHLLSNKINYEKIYTGIHFSSPNNSNYRNYLDYQLMLLTNRLHLNRYLRDKYNLFSLTYEDFEYELKEPIFKLLSSQESNTDKISDHIRYLQKHGKQQYVNSNYLDYFDDKVKEVFEYWNIL
jgi:hypothetical protein